MSQTYAPEAENMEQSAPPKRAMLPLAGVSEQKIDERLSSAKAKPKTSDFSKPGLWAKYIVLRQGAARAGAEVVTLPTVSAGMEGRAPTLQEFADAAVLIAFLHGSSGALVKASDAARTIQHKLGGPSAKALASLQELNRTIRERLELTYIMDGKTPRTMVEAAARDPKVIDDLLAPGRGVPGKIAGETAPTEALPAPLPKQVPKQVPELAAPKAGQTAEMGEAKALEAAAGKAGGAVCNGNGSLVFRENKWDYLFGRVVSNKHNQDRSLQLKDAMEKLGIKETPESQKILLDHLDEVARSSPPVIKKGKFIYGAEKTVFYPKDLVEKHSFFTGPSGVKVKFETIYEVCDDGSLRFVTTVPKFLKPNYGVKK